MEVFVTRSDIVAPKINVVPGTAHNSANGSGFWLLAPYLRRDPPESDLKSPAHRSHVEAGPYIYDTGGNLVWSGSHISQGKTTLDFRQSKLGGFTLSLMSYVDGGLYFNGTPVVLNSSLQPSYPVSVPQAEDAFIDPHEFQLMEQDTYLVQTITTIKLPRSEKRILAGGFYEIDRVSGKTMFEWSSVDHIGLSESAMSERSPEEPLDYLHLNSVDKSENGDYLISARHTNTIYLISGRDGSIMWRLGGDKSSYHLQDFNFSAQHDARFLPSHESNITLLSFLDNASNELLPFSETSQSSSAVVVALNDTSMQASLVRRQWRPDGKLSKLRGNVQVKPSTNHMFVCWSEDGYIAEFDAKGNLIVEARFADPHLTTYRAYKLESASWTTPRDEIPILRTLSLGDSASSAAFFVSWNGAHNVARWDLIGCFGDETSQDPCKGVTHKIVEFNKNGFESGVNVTLPTGVQEAFVFAVGVSGEILGRSDTVSLNPSLMLDPSHDLEVGLESYGAQTRAHAGGGIGDEMLAIALAAIIFATVAIGLFQVLFPTDRAEYDDDEYKF